MNSYRIPEIAKQYMEYDMIQLYTELPDFPELRSHLLFAFLNASADSRPSSELYTLVTSLVQMALDTHEMVTPSNEIKEKKAARSRQLKVLAGDYFSSRFYHLLAQAGRIDTVKQLSGAICEVNRLKMNVYTKMKQLKMTAEDYIEQTVEIKSQLFLSFSDIMADAYGRTWPDILRSFTHCEVIFEEIFRTESTADFQGSWAFWHILQHGTKEERKQLQVEDFDADSGKVRAFVHKYNISSQLYQMLDSNFEQLQTKVQLLDSDTLISELFHIGEPFRLFLAKRNKAVEEI